MDECHLPSTDPEALRRVYGFAVPKAFLKLLELVNDPDGSVNGRDGSLFQMVTGLLLADQSDAHPGTPPELFLIGRTGMDGVTCGCVLHDDRLAGDPPLAMFDPGQLRGDYLGLDTRRSLGALMGIQLAQRDPGDDSHDPLQVIAQMGFDPDELPPEQPLGLRPRTPPGWKLAMTADGLGVMAETKHFAPGQPFDDDPESFESLDVADYLARARAAIADGYAATALWHLRNGYTFWAAKRMPEELTAAMVEVYKLLGRTRLVERLETAITLHRDSE